MEIDWVQWQLVGYTRDSQRLLQRLQNGEGNGMLAHRALELLHSYLNIPPIVPNRHQADKSIVELAQILYIYVQGHGFWEDICTLWPKLQSIAKPLPDPTLYVQLGKQLAIVKNARGEVNEAQALYEGLINAANFGQLPREQQADVYHQAGVCYYYQGNYSRAEQLLLSCITIHDQQDDCGDIAKNQQHDKSTNGLRVNAAAPPVWESKAYGFNQLGNLALFQGNFKEAQDHYDESLNLFLKHGEADNLACVAYQALGRLFVIQRRFAEAIPLLEKNLFIRRQREEAGGSAHSTIYLAAAYIGQRRLVEAESLLNEAMITCSTLQIRRSMALCYLYYGYLEQHQGKLDDALKHWRQAQTVANAIPAPAVELQALAPLITGLLRTCRIREMGATLIRLCTTLRQQSLGPMAAGRLLFCYLRW